MPIRNNVIVKVVAMVAYTVIIKCDVWVCCIHYASSAYLVRLLRRGEYGGINRSAVKRRQNRVFNKICQLSVPACNQLIQFLTDACCQFSDRSCRSELLIILIVSVSINCDLYQGGMGFAILNFVLGLTCALCQFVAKSCVWARGGALLICLKWSIRYLLGSRACKSY